MHHDMRYLAVNHLVDITRTTDVVAKHFQSREVCAMAGATHAGDDRHTQDLKGPA